MTLKFLFLALTFLFFNFFKIFIYLLFSSYSSCVLKLTILSWSWCIHLGDIRTFQCWWDIKLGAPNTCFLLPGFPMSVRSITIHSGINAKSFKGNHLQHICHPHPSDLHTCMLQPCSTLCNPVDCSPPGFSVHGIARQEYWSGLPFPSPSDVHIPHQTWVWFWVIPLLKIVQWFLIG